jgi:hypothetical protein
MEQNKWKKLEAKLNLGRFHHSACILKDRFIYVFGGYYTKGFHNPVTLKITRKNEILESCQSNSIEMYDTCLDEDISYYSSTDDEERESYIVTPPSRRPVRHQPSINKTWKKIHVKRDYFNNAGSLIVIPLYNPGSQEESS